MKKIMIILGMVLVVGTVSSASAGLKRTRSQAASAGDAADSTAALSVLESTQASLVDIADEDGVIDFSRYSASHQILLRHFLNWVKRGEGFTIGKPKAHVFKEEKVQVTSYALVKGVDVAGRPIVERYGYVVERQKEDSRWAPLLFCYAEPYQELELKIPHTQESLEPYVHDETSSYEAARSAFRDHRINWRLYKRLLGGHVRWQRYSPAAADRRSLHRVLTGSKFALSPRIVDYLINLN